MSCSTVAKGAPGRLWLVTMQPCRSSAVKAPPRLTWPSNSTGSSSNRGCCCCCGTSFGLRVGWRTTSRTAAAAFLKSCVSQEAVLCLLGMAAEGAAAEELSAPGWSVECCCARACTAIHGLMASRMSSTRAPACNCLQRQQRDGWQILSLPNHNRDDQCACHTRHDR